MKQGRRFWPTSRGTKMDGSIVQPIEFCRENPSMRPLVVSIPRTCGNAVKRNRLKRVLKHSVKTHLDSLPKGKGLWIRIQRQNKIHYPITRLSLEKLIKEAQSNLSF